MTYINPIELLHAFADDGELLGLDEKAVRRARRKLLAEADLEGALEFKGISLSKNEIAVILDELDDEDRFVNHQIIYETKLLLNFLNEGDPEIFDLEDEYDIYDYYANFDLIAKPFAIQFAKLFDSAVRHFNASQVDNMSRFLVFIDDDANLDLCLKGVDKFLARVLDEFETIISELKDEELDSLDIEDIYDGVYFRIDTDTLNALPDYFALRRDRLASSIDQIAVNLFNNYNETETAFELSEIAVEINSESLTHNRIKHNKGVFESDLAQIEFAKRLKKIERISAIAEELKKFTKIVNERFVLGAKDNKFGNRLFIDGLKDEIRSILDFNEINGLPEELDIGESLRDSIAIELKKLSIVCYNCTHDLDFALSLVEMALQINVSSLTYNDLLKNKNKLVSRKSFVNYPSVNEKHYVNENLSESGNPKTNSGQNIKSGSANKNGTSGSSNHRQNQHATTNKKQYTNPLFRNYEVATQKLEINRIIKKIAAVLVVFFLLAIIYFNYLYNNKLESLNAGLQKMNSGTGFILPKKTSEKINQVKLKRKLLPINAQTKRVDSSFYDRMAPEVKADLFDDVNTFAWIDCRTEDKYFLYPSYRSSRIMSCDLVAVDKLLNAVILKKNFEEMPSTGQTIDVPYERIIDYLVYTSEK